MRNRWCVALLALGAVYGQDRQPGQGVNFYNKEKEAALGAQLAKEVRRHTTPTANPAVADYVKHVAERLAAQLPPDWTWNIETVREDAGGSTHEPVALPAGYIFVSEYLIAEAHSEAEFAGMLAHAMSHVAARHYTRNATRGTMLTIGSQATGATGDYSMAVPLGMLPFQRASELEADNLAVKTMAAAGFDPSALEAYVGRTQAKPPQVNQVFSPLPERDKRVEAMQSAIGKLPAGTYQATGEFARIQALVKIPAPAPHLNQ